MNIQLKPLILGIAISSVGLSSTIACASANLTFTQSVNDEVIVSQIFSLPKLKNINKAAAPLSQLDPFNLLLNKPLLRFPLNEVPNIKPSNPSKKNQVFEIASIFNDKLQQIFASIQLPATEETVTAVTASKTVNSNCRASKS